MGKYFGTDGFRGEAGITLTADHAYKVGRFLGWYYYNALRERNGNNEPARIVIGKTAKPVKAAKPKRDEAGFIIPYAMFRPIRGPGLICELLGNTPVRRSADLKMNLDYLMREAYEHAIEQIMCGVRLQEVRC